MFLLVACQHASGTCQSHFCPVLSLRKVPRKYVELSPNTSPFLTLQFRKKDLMPTPNLLRILPIPPPLGHILSNYPNKIIQFGISWACTPTPPPTPTTLVVVVLCSRYTAFFEQSIPFWNNKSDSTYIGIQYWKNVLIRNQYNLHTYVRTWYKPRILHT
jgi:hypothetical protein